MKHFIIALLFLLPLIASAQNDSVNAIGVVNLSTLRGTSYQYFAAKTKNASDMPKVTLLGYYSPGDGGGGDFYWSDTSTRIDDGGVVIQPTGIAGAGRWIRHYDPAGFVNVLWFGFKSDGTTDNYSRWVQLMNYLRSVKINADPNNANYAYYSQLHKVYFPPAFGFYKFGRTLHISYNMQVEGGSSYHTNWSSKLLFPADSVGIVISFPDIDSAGLGTTGTIFKNIKAQALSDGSFDTTAHGFKITGFVYFDNVGVENFGGNGFDMDVTGGGNVDLSYFTRCYAAYNWNGFYSRGADANQSTFIACDARLNRKWNFLDRGFLGNTYISCHSSDAGITQGQKTFVIHRIGGTGPRYQYAARHDGFLRTPGVTAGWEDDWYFIGDSTKFYYGDAAAYNSSVWYWNGGAYAIDSNQLSGQNQTSWLYNCYSEGGQLGSYIGQNSGVIGGQHGAGFQNGNPVVVSAAAASLHIPFTPLRIGSITRNNLSTIDSLGVDVRVPSSGIRMGYDKILNTGELLELHSTSSRTKLFTGATDPSDFSRLQVSLGSLMQIDGLYSGSFDDALNTKRIVFGSARPTFGSWNQGDIIFNKVPGAIDTLYWRCIVSGTPGTWESIVIAAGGGSGVTTVGTFSGSSQPNGASISGDTITFGPVDGTNPGLVTSGAQAIPGVKTFSESIVAGSTSTGTSTVPLTINANSGHNTYLFAAGKNGNPAYFRIDKDGNIADIGGNAAPISSSNGKPFFPSGFASSFWASAQNGASLLTGLSGAMPWVIDNRTVTTDNITGLTIFGSNASIKGNLLQLWSKDNDDLTDFNAVGKISRYANSSITNGQLLIGHGSNGTFEKGTLSSSDGSLTITNGGGSINLEVSGSFASSGTYTPTLTNTTNISTSTAHTLQYIRVGNVVTVSGDVEIDPTAQSNCELRLSLPFSSSFSSTTQAGGSAMTDLSIDNGKVTAVSSSTVVAIKFAATNTSNKTYSVHFTYHIQ